MRGPDTRTTTKKDLVHRIAEQTGQTKVVVKEVIQRFLDEIVDELAMGHRLEFRDFGVFEVKERAPRQAQNPKTLEKVEVSLKRQVRFKVGRMMRRKVCEQPAPKPAAEPRPPQAQEPPPKPPARPSSPF